MELSRVVVDENRAEGFEVKRGLGSGVSLSHMLFNVGSECVLQKSSINKNGTIFHLRP